VIADAAVDDDGIADFELVVGDSAEIADGIDDARGIGAEDPWWGYRDTGQAADDEEIQMIERGRFDAHADLAAPGLGLQQVGSVLDFVESAVLGDSESSHGII
jgi:hypothetical protein